MEVKTEYRTSAQVAKVFRMTSKNVQRLTADGILETVETPRGRRYDWDKTVEMYVAYLSDKANGREKKETTAELEEAKLRSEVDIKEAKAKAAQMELKELQGKMHRAEDVEAIAVNPSIDISDLERIKGFDVLKLTDIGMLFTYRRSGATSEENNSEKPSGNTAEPFTQVSEKSEK